MLAAWLLSRLSIAHACFSCPLAGYPFSWARACVSPWCVAWLILACLPSDHAWLLLSCLILASYLAFVLCTSASFVLACLLACCLPFHCAGLLCFQIRACFIASFLALCSPLLSVRACLVLALLACCLPACLSVVLACFGFDLLALSLASSHFACCCLLVLVGLLGFAPSFLLPACLPFGGCLLWFHIRLLAWLVAVPCICVWFSLPAAVAQAFATTLSFASALPLWFCLPLCVVSLLFCVCHVHLRLHSQLALQSLVALSSWSCLPFVLCHWCLCLPCAISTTGKYVFEGGDFRRSWTSLELGLYTLAMGI